MVQINSKKGNKILNKYINTVGRVNPHTKKTGVTYSCKLGKIGINNTPVTPHNCNNQVSYENSLSRCR